jgi:DNA topoisomerase-1
MNPSGRMATSMNGDGWWLRSGTPKRGFQYVGLTGKVLTAPATIRRIEALVIPPAWTGVHIAPDPARKVQAWGIDQAGRRQYIYSERAVQARDRRKWRRVQRVARVLPHLREVTNAHLKRTEPDREKVLATVVRLICRAYFRAGNERYAVQNRTFGICTLSKRHVRIEGESLVFAYKGKQKKEQRQVVADTPLVGIIEQLLALPGRRLFKYHESTNGGQLRPVTANAVNRYLQELLDERYTSKDLRTFGGTVRAATILADLGPAKSEHEARKNVALACKLVSVDLGNTPTICRKAYIHPAVLEEYERAGRTVETVSAKRQQARSVESEEPVGYYPEELALMHFLERYG